MILVGSENRFNVVATVRNGKFDVFHDLIFGKIEFYQTASGVENVLG